MPDFQAPVILSGPTVSAITATSTVISWQTNERTTGGVKYGLTDPPAMMVNETSSVTEHSLSINGLAANTTYYVSVFGIDAAGNGPVESGVISFTTAQTPDTKAPVIISGPIVSAIGPTSAVIAWTTNEPSTGHVNYGLTDLLGQSVADNTLAITHRVTLTGLSPETVYYLNVDATDGLGNGPTVSGTISFNTVATPDSAAPQIIEGPMVINITDTGATVYWTTDEPATSGVSYNDGTAYGVSSNNALVTEHLVHLEGLTAATLYNYTVSSKDGLNNGPTLSGEGEFTTLDTPDTHPPVIVEYPVKHVNHQQAIIAWRTDEPASSVIEYGLAADALTQLESHAALTQPHNMTLTGLQSGTTYFFRIVSTDAAGNVSTSQVWTFTTDAAPSDKKPEVTKPPKAEYTADDTVTISWETDEPTDTVLEYNVPGQAPQRRSEADKETQHQVTLKGLQPDTAYEIAISATDSDGNTTLAKLGAQKLFVAFTGGGGAFVPQTTVVTLPDPDVTPPVIYTVAVVGLSDTSATIQWETDEISDSLVRYGVSGGALNLQAGNALDVAVHTIVLTNLSANTQYDFNVESIDPSGNGPTIMIGGSFTTLASADVTAPTITSGPTATAVYNTSARIEWSTDEVASTAVNYGTVSGSLGQSRAVAGNVLDHVVTLTGLTAGTTYYYEVVSTDGSGNTVTSDETSVTTTGAPPLDSDGDGIGDASDNCVEVANADQSDVNFNLIGDACDPADTDGDGFSDAQEVAAGTDPADGASVPNLPTVAAPKMLIFPEAQSWTSPTDTAWVYWQASPDAGVGYELQGNLGTGWDTIYSGTALGVNVPIAIGTMNFRVRATKDGFAPSGWVTTNHDLTVTGACRIPGIFNVATWASQDSLPLFWKPSTTPEVIYHVQMNDGSGWSGDIYVGTANSITATGLTSGKSYSFRVMATRTDFAPSAWRTSGSCAVSYQAAMPGTFTVATWSSQESLPLSWEPSATPNVTYHVQMNDGSGWSADIYADAANSATATGLVNGKDYSFRVMATRDGFVPSAWRTSGSCAVSLQAGIPGKLSVPGWSSNGALTVGWVPSQTEGVDYELQRSDNGAAFITVYTGPLTTQDFSLANGSYAFRVRATKTGYSPSTWRDGSNVVNVAGQCRPPGRIKVPTTTPIGDVTLYWKASQTDGATYELQWDNGGGWADLANTVDTQFALTGLASGSYRFRVRAVEASSMPSVWIESEPCVVTLQCSIPKWIGGVNPTTGIIYWGASSMAGVAYELQADRGLGWSTVYTGSALEFDTAGLASGTYRFQVRATMAGYIPSAWRVGKGTSTIETPVITVEGVAAAGAPLIGFVTLKDSAGSVLGPQQLAADGGFSFDVTGLIPPFFLYAEGQAGFANFELHHVAAADGVNNLNPLTDLVSRAATNGAITDVFAEGANPQTVLDYPSLQASLDEAVAAFQSMLQPLLDQFDASINAYLTQPFSADGSGADQLFDLVEVTVSANGGLFDIKHKADGTELKTGDLQLDAIKTAPPIDPSVTGSVATVKTDMEEIAPFLAAFLTEVKQGSADWIADYAAAGGDPALEADADSAFYNRLRPYFVADPATFGWDNGQDLDMVVWGWLADFEDNLQIEGISNLAVMQRLAEGHYLLVGNLLWNGVVDPMETPVGVFKENGAWKLIGNGYRVDVEAYSYTGRKVWADGVVEDHAGIDFGITTYDPSITRVVVQGLALPVGGLELTASAFLGDDFALPPSEMLTYANGWQNPYIHPLDSLEIEALPAGGTTFSWEIYDANGLVQTVPARLEGRPYNVHTMLPAEKDVIYPTMVIPSQSFAWGVANLFDGSYTFDCAVQAASPSLWASVGWMDDYGWNDIEFDVNTVNSTLTTTLGPAPAGLSYLETWIGTWDPVHSDVETNYVFGYDSNGNSVP